MTSKTLKTRQRKAEIDQELNRLEESIRIFSKPKVYVKLEPEMELDEWTMRSSDVIQHDRGSSIYLQIVTLHLFIHLFIDIFRLLILFVQ